MRTIRALEKKNTVVCGMVMNPDVGDGTGRAITGDAEYIQVNHCSGSESKGIEIQNVQQKGFYHEFQT